MPNFKQPDDGVALSGPISVLQRDNSFVKVFDENGISREPQSPQVRYAKPPITSAAAPSLSMVQQLCTMLAPAVAEALMKSSAFLGRICLMPQVPPVSGLGYSSLAASYKYTFGATAVTVSPTTRNTYSETLPVDITISNSSLVGDLAFRMGANLAAAADTAILGVGSLDGFTTNASVGTGAVPITSTVLNAAVALMPNTGEPIFLVGYCPNGYNVGAVPEIVSAPVPPYPISLAAIETLANGASPTANLQGVWGVPSPFCVTTGSAPVTRHNVMFTPSAWAAVFEIETVINNTNTTAIANCSSVGSFGNATVTVWALQTATGTQTIYASMVLGFAVAINANGVQVFS